MVTMRRIVDARMNVKLKSCRAESHGAVPNKHLEVWYSVGRKAF
jgi:hypothetical protein